MKRILRSGVVVALATAVLAGCTTLPYGPAVTTLPGARKTLEQFNADDAACRVFAQNALGPYANVPGNDAAAANVVGGTLLGAAVGAIIGAASGNAGAGAAIGAGTGLLGGSAAAANVSGFSTAQLQALYDRAYVQCMFSRGNVVPGQVAFQPGSRVTVIGAPAIGAVPPGYRSPPQTVPVPGGPPPSAPSGGYPPPSAAPPPSGYPPLNTAPPPATGYPPPSAGPPPSGFPPASTPPPVNTPPRG